VSAPERDLIAVLDYGIGNLRSAEKALQHVGANARLVSDPDVARSAIGVVLPGVGAFGSCARALASSGLDAVARDVIDGQVPFLGICIGFQLLFEGSEESPKSSGLGVFPGVVRALPEGVKHPQMQWNRLEIVEATPSGLFAGWGSDPWVYFVHSYAPEQGAETAALCDYGGPVVAAATRDNVWGTQFHPEKSSSAGLALLKNFATRCAERADAPAPH
jgi:glutamine amidotransferase